MNLGKSMLCGGSNKQSKRIMGQRIGAFKAKNAQLIIWENQGKLSFEFAKHYKDKQTQQWKQTKTLYLDELREIGEMFLRAATWGAKKAAVVELPKGIETTKTTIDNVLEKVKERYERSN